MKNIDIYKSVNREDLIKKYTAAPNLSEEKKQKMVSVVSNFITLFKKKHMT